jgi:hypothetical protein
MSLVELTKKTAETWLTNKNLCSFNDYTYRYAIVRVGSRRLRVGVVRNIKTKNEAGRSLGDELGDEHIGCRVVKYGV